MRLAVTRTEKQLTDLSHRAAECGVEIIPLPVTRSEPLAFTWPQDLKPESIDWLAFTSANAVQPFFSRLTELEIAMPVEINIGAVGKHTARTLQEHDLKAAFIPAQSGAKALFFELVDRRLADGSTLVYPHAEDVAFDPVDLTGDRQIKYYPIICYRTVRQPITPSQIEQLASEDYILFTAPSAIDSYQEQLGRPVAQPIAIGPTTATRMNHHEWSGFITMKTPSLDNVLEYLPWN